jgi:hypothetical protein
MDAAYYHEFKPKLRSVVMESYNRLADHFEAHCDVEKIISLTGIH